VTTRGLILSAVGLVAFLSPLLAHGEDTSDRRPIPIAMPLPVYPFAMRKNGIAGSVVVDFFVGKQGEVLHVRVIKSSNPEFDEPARSAVASARFKPGYKGGHTVFTHMEVPLMFELDDGPGGFEDPGLRIAPTGSANLPEKLQYKSPPRPFLTWRPVYPLELLKKNITGSATVTFLIDAEGHPHVYKLRDATDPDFGAAAGAMVEGWDFIPATKGPDEPSWALVTWTQKFEPRDRVGPIFASEQRLLKHLRDGDSHIVKDELDLDSPLRSVFQPGPMLPASVKNANVPADATIEIIVDRDGHAQLPRILSASTPEYGWAAATATARWLYSVPTRKGQHVDVFVRVPMAYTPVK
jgi:TonB family protein